MKMKKTMSI